MSSTKKVINAYFFVNPWRDTLFLHILMAGKMIVYQHGYHPFKTQILQILFVCQKRGVITLTPSPIQLMTSVYKPFAPMKKAWLSHHQMIRSSELETGNVMLPIFVFYYFLMSLVHNPQSRRTSCDLDLVV